jgi:hypothetical protein
MCENARRAIDTERAGINTELSDRGRLFHRTNQQEGARLHPRLRVLVTSHVGNPTLARGEVGIAGRPKRPRWMAGTSTLAVGNS